MSWETCSDCSRTVACFPQEQNGFWSTSEHCQRQKLPIPRAQGWPCSFGAPICTTCWHLAPSAFLMGSSSVHSNSVELLFTYAVSLLSNMCTSSPCHLWMLMATSSLLLSLMRTFYGSDLKLDWFSNLLQVKEPQGGTRGLQARSGCCGTLAFAACSPLYAFS